LLELSCNCLTNFWFIMFWVSVQNYCQHSNQWCNSQYKITVNTEIKVWHNWITIFYLWQLSIYGHVSMFWVINFVIICCFCCYCWYASYLFMTVHGTIQYQRTFLMHWSNKETKIRSIHLQCKNSLRHGLHNLATQS